MVSAVVHFLKRPAGKRRTYALIRRTTRADGTRHHETLKNDSLAALNVALTSGAIQPAAADLQAKQLVTQLNKQARLARTGEVCGQ
jgi:hypothetical protein